jgi:DNA-binding CsgD family transcriptional regulator
MLLEGKEIEILDYVARGKTNRQIAEAMCYSQQSVKRQMAAIMRKLGAKSRTHAIALAVAYGLIDVRSKANAREMHVRRAAETHSGDPRPGESYAELKLGIAMLSEQLAMLADLIAENRQHQRDMAPYHIPAPRRLRKALNLD